MVDPESMSPGSIMPPYPWLVNNDMKLNQVPKKIKALRKLGTPYPEGFEEEAIADLQAQAQEIAASLKKDGIEQEGLADKEIIALVAYLQRLGTDIKLVDVADKLTINE